MVNLALDSQEVCGSVQIENVIRESLRENIIMEVAGLIIEQRYEVPDDPMATVYNKCKRIAEPVWATYDFHGGDVAFCKVLGPAKPH